MPKQLNSFKVLLEIFFQLRELHLSGVYVSSSKNLAMGESYLNFAHNQIPYIKLPFLNLYIQKNIKN
nr:hypothetical protein Iba_chr10dCG6600 [Ipomoea batatas]